MTQQIDLEDLNKNYETAKFAEDLEEMKRVQKMEEARAFGTTIGMIEPPSYMQPFYTDYSGAPMPDVVPTLKPNPVDKQQMEVISKCVLEMAKTAKDQAQEIEDLKRVKRKQDNFQPNRPPGCGYCGMPGHTQRQCRIRLDDIQTAAMGQQLVPYQQPAIQQLPGPPVYQQYAQYSQYPSQGQYQGHQQGQNWKQNYNRAGQGQGPRPPLPKRRWNPQYVSRDGAGPSQQDSQPQAQSENSSGGDNKYRAQGQETN